MCLIGLLDMPCKVDTGGAHIAYSYIPCKIIYLLVLLNLFQLTLISMALPAKVVLCCCRQFVVSYIEEVLKFILFSHPSRYIDWLFVSLWPVNCPPGTYSDSKASTCKDCNPGFYQDEEGKTECQPCPKNSSSVIAGSKSIADCKRTFKQ